MSVFLSGERRIPSMTGCSGALRQALCLFCISACFLSSGIFAERILIDGVAAVVGRRVLTLREVDAEGRMILIQRAGAQGADREMDDAFRRSVLEYLIVQELLVQEARRGYGIVIREADIEVELNGLQTKFESPEAFQKATSQLGLSEENLRATFRRELIVKAFLNQVLDFETEISNREAATYLREHQGALADVPDASKVQAAKRALRMQLRDAQFTRLVAELRRNQEIRVIAAYGTEPTR